MPFDNNLLNIALYSVGIIGSILYCIFLKPTKSQDNIAHILKANEKKEQQKKNNRFLL